MNGIEYGYSKLKLNVQRESNNEESETRAVAVLYDEIKLVSYLNIITNRPRLDRPPSLGISTSILVISLHFNAYPKRDTWTRHLA